jgi:hypothetical protein
MAASLKYAVGATLVHRQDNGLTAEIVEAKLFNGIEHYRINVRPAHIHNSAIWLSGFGLDREFARSDRKAKTPPSREGSLMSAVGRLIRLEPPRPRRAA